MTGRRRRGAFHAMYGGYCRRCDFQIQQGQLIKAIGTDEYVHVECPMPPSAPPAPMCPRCGYPHYVGSECRE